MQDLLIALLAKNTSQLADWQYREVIVEKINEIIVFINDRTGEEISDISEREREEKEEEERNEKAKIEEARAAEELAKQNAGGNQV